MCRPSKTEVRFRQQTFLHDFIRDSISTDEGPSRSTVVRNPRPPRQSVPLPRRTRQRGWRCPWQNCSTRQPLQEASLFARPSRPRSASGFNSTEALPSKPALRRCTWPERRGHPRQRLFAGLQRNPKPLASWLPRWPHSSHSARFANRSSWPSITKASGSSTSTSPTDAIALFEKVLKQRTAQL